ncbi:MULTISPECIES: HoxN/HupN/NixA family nickel/cobalt transporter [Burkholderia]|jgi:high-affinity nickel-transport protein|uniref:Nickel/cobalt efflux system n=1 Tax=Burkholderia gladioli TaxID=28095 RepID=A0AAW3F8B6_BURGA|nr:MULTISPECIES: HoxN/HupN/NixA family nickel/cobalt transporter [Burkholderia]AJX00215.1 high-affinity nickel transport protein [Burkholderia gladioli]ASD80647.1 HoxN/HupN/NixA family nickel/cobalt transporter [Burkholderia gladioli pv. gladioli]AWY54118.1 HoxN/HupN/NixA family nickel/cobalt transporter [Burkholderia gladioli pv. gladioli]AYQ86167.1 HoxN/HupN/NixA family nickel/cobalt transporter [Burkholderia gladioli]KGC17583.1 high-affinity nickel transport protein [Burkholderia gladioli]
MPTLPSSSRRQLFLLYAGLIGANLAAWIWALVVLHDHPLLLGTAALAYGFGLRHAVDADHIAAIDTVTRKLMQDGKRPFSVGLFFSLGHSTIVILATLGIAISALALRSRFDGFKAVGGTIGTAVSAGFLLVLALINLVILRDIWRRYRRARAAGAEAAAHHEHEAGSHHHAPGGLLTRLLRPLFRLVTRSAHMYPVGLLFGLGFDTATEIGLLAIAAAQANQGLPLHAVLVFPALFTAGMTLIDSTDNVLMVHAYGWAMDDPKRKLAYNLSITFVSAAVALVIGGVEALGLAADKLGLAGGFWDAIGAINERFGAIGYGIVALFLACWVGSILFHRWRRASSQLA